jgi:Protein of unknown function (DUF3592)
MKKFRWVFFLFLGIGVLMLCFALLLWNKSRGLLANGSHAQGTVVELREIRKDDGHNTYRPVVRFTTAGGRDITYEESFSSNPAPYDVGASVEVLYPADDPDSARIKSFGSLWLGPTILGGMGLVFASIGVGYVLFARGQGKKKDYLLAYGNSIETELQGVERNGSLEINGKNPWRITSQWLDPASNKLRVFYSENLWFDPTRFVTRKQVTVLLDPKNPQRYYMDVSFLPELADS